MDFHMSDCVVQTSIGNTPVEFCKCNDNTHLLGFKFAYENYGKLLSVDL